MREAGIVARRLVRAPAGGRRRGAWRPSGSVLVTGGTGALGGHVARWVAGQGAGHVVLASRRGLAAAGAAGLAAQVAALGAGVTVAACDVADRVGAGRAAGPAGRRGPRGERGGAHGRGAG